MKIVKKNFNVIPKEWFFFNPINNVYDKYFFKISNKIGVIFFYENKDEKNKFLKKVRPYILWCKAKGISFMIQGSIFWANKYKAFGIFLDQKNLMVCNKLNFNSIKKKFWIAGKVHNLKEAKSFGTLLNLVFISNVFETKTYPDKKKLSTFRFFSLCFLLKSKKIFALGGVNKNNFKKLKNKHLYGFGAISYFKS